ncbi:MAG: hypothetical protein GY737_23990 [Desulfobacteraceae bacterium]|nr:hypothetical protein [Desulfobacteraceae bacterium]
MKRYLFTILLVFQFLLPGLTHALEKLSEVQLKSIHAQSGISMAADDVSIYLGADALEFKAIENMDAFGLPTSDTGYLSLNDILGLVIFDCEARIDVGIYTAPEEHLVVTDIGKKDGLFDDKHEHWYVKNRTAGTIDDSVFQYDPYYWEIGDDITRPLDERFTVIQASIQDFTSVLDLRSTMTFCGKNLGSVEMSGLSMPEFIHDNVHLPGSVVTLFPGQGSSINLEMRVRLSLDEFSMSGSGSSSSPDFVVSGVHIGEAFGAELPDHLEDTGLPGGSTINTSAWGSDIVNLMHSGYFLLGNLNQIEFSDTIDDIQLCKHLGRTNDESDDNLDPVGLIANPLSLNFTTEDSRSYASISTGVHGSLRIESVKGWDGNDMGPIAVDGIRVKHCVIEFPGGYKHPDGSFKGRIHPSQLDWLNELVNQP